ncbi:CD1375 family protein [Paenibacillus sp. TAB 01]
MVTVTVALIIAGRRTFDQVPASIRDDVRADLLALGLDENGKPLPIE